MQNTFTKLFTELNLASQGSFPFHDVRQLANSNFTPVTPFITVKIASCYTKGHPIKCIQEAG